MFLSCSTRPQIHCAFGVLLPTVPDTAVNPRVALRWRFAGRLSLSPSSSSSLTGAEPEHSQVSGASEFLITTLLSTQVAATKRLG